MLDGPRRSLARYRVRELIAAFGWTEGVHAGKQAENPLLSAGPARRSIEAMIGQPLGDQSLLIPVFGPHSR